MTSSEQGGARGASRRIDTNPKPSSSSRRSSRRVSSSDSGMWAGSASAAIDIPSKREKDPWTQQIEEYANLSLAEMNMRMEYSRSRNEHGIPSSSRSWSSAFGSEYGDPAYMAYTLAHGGLGGASSYARDGATSGRLGRGVADDGDSDGAEEEDEDEEEEEEEEEDDSQRKDPDPDDDLVFDIELS